MGAKAAEGQGSSFAAWRTTSVLTFGCFALVAVAAPALAAPRSEHIDSGHASRVIRHRVVAHARAAHSFLHRVSERTPAEHAAHHWVHRVAYHHPAHAWHHVVHEARRERAVHRLAWRHPVHRWRMSCVPFARADSGIKLAGDAYAWWGHAAGVYARGDAPVPGSVLAFRANVRMRLGHVAVVSRVINRREIEVDQANWGDGGAITRSVPVIDVSEDNDWTAVRVALGDGRYGSVYPTYGFIYDRPDTGTMLASARAPAPELAANPAPSDLRPLNRGGEEVAELPGPIPSPPRWPARLGHSLHTSFAHRDLRHAAYRHHPVSHWNAHRAPVHHVLAHRVTTHHAPARDLDASR
jgi:CHAP domain